MREGRDNFRSPVGSIFMVQMEDVKLATNLAREERRKHGGQDEEVKAATSSTMLRFDLEGLRKARAERLRSSAALPLASSQQEPTLEIPTTLMYTSQAREATSCRPSERAFALPPGNTRVDEKDYEEATIPITKRAPRRAGERVITLPKWTRLAAPPLKPKRPSIASSPSYTLSRTRPTETFSFVRLWRWQSGCFFTHHPQYSVSTHHPYTPSGHGCQNYIAA
ncbi:hypothetical protein BGX29_000499 [Mortierella sp. GBA35]|nr:hypothetical protein BGX29_000499 [Mortierella sp. GBA35]